MGSLILHYLAEFLVFVSLFLTRQYVIGIFAVIGILITSVYILRAVQKIFLGEIASGLNPVFDVFDVNDFEKPPLIILVLVMFVFGIYPKLLLEVMSTSTVFLSRFLNM